MKEYKTIILEGIEYNLVPKGEKILLSAEELSFKVPYSIHTIRKLKKEMTKDEHYYQHNNGKIMFHAINAVAFLEAREKGKQKNENIERKCVPEERQSVSMDQFVDQWKKDKAS